jgi:hypothetical protein
VLVLVGDLITSSVFFATLPDFDKEAVGLAL